MDNDNDKTELGLSDSGDLPESPGSTEDRVPNYRLLQQIGEGGMGEVWEGLQEHPVRRTVAIKLIKAGMDTKQVVARFESERQALALMNHSSIARVLDAGVTERGRPFFAMERVKGDPITDYCDRHRLPTRERLELFMLVCDGVQHAHQKGVIHRDIKPSNVLVQIEDNKPVPKIIDFGVAKATSQPLTDRTMFTQIGAIIGTPEYMSPEQAELTGVDIDTRSDVYSLGVLLYEMLVGTLPFDPKEFAAEGIDEMRRRIREDDPQKPSTRLTSLGGVSSGLAQKRKSDPSTLMRRLRGDLDWITMKALEKDRTRRYGSPAELSADIQRHLDDEPVLAGPPGTAYRLKKFVRRHKVGAVVGGLLVLVVLGGLAGTTYGLIRATRAEAEARTEAAIAEQVSGFVVDLFKVSDPGQARGNTITAREILDRGAENIGAELTDQPRVHARMMGTIGAVYRNLGLYAEARPLLEEALQTRESAVGADDPELIGDLNGLGTLLFRLGDQEGARELFDRALKIRERVLPPDHPDLAESLNYLGGVAQRLGDHEQARKLYEDSLAIREKALGPDDPAIASNLTNLANVLSRMDDNEKARELHERALSIREKALGRDHFRVGYSLANLANILQELGDHEGAQPLYTRALVVLEKSLGPDHARVGYTENSLARLMKKVGDYDGARSHYERALAILESALGSKHATTTLVVYNLARVAALQSDVEEALDLLGQAVDRGIGERIRALRYEPIGTEPDLTSLHGDPRFDALVARADRDG